MYCRSKAEEDAWLEVSHQYNTYRAEMLAELEKQSLAKAKGKQRASADEIDEWEVDERALSEHFRRSGSLDLARKVVGPEGGKSPLGGRLQDLEYTVRRNSFFVRSCTNFDLGGPPAHTRAFSPRDHAYSRVRSEPPLCPAEHLPIDTRAARPVFRTSQSRRIVVILAAKPDTPATHYRSPRPPACPLPH